MATLSIATVEVEDDGDAIGTWADQEGSAHLTQSTSSSQPVLKTNQLNGNQVIRTDGDDDFMDIAFAELSQPIHIFTVIQYQGPTTTSNDKRIHASEAENNHCALMIETVDEQFELESGGNRIEGTTIDNILHIINSLFDGANSYMRVDGTRADSGDVGTNGLNGFSIGHSPGGGQNSNTDFAEILVYTASLSDSEVSDVELYLSDKWGVSI